MKLPVSIAIAGALVALASLWLFRWEVTSTGNTTAILLDRWTGRLEVIAGGTRRTVIEKQAPVSAEDFLNGK